MASLYLSEQKLNTAALEEECLAATKALPTLDWLCKQDEEFTTTKTYYNQWWQTRFSSQEKAGMSALAKKLFLGDHSVEQQQHHNFSILVWKYGKAIEKRLLYNYGQTYRDPFEHCSVQNCQLTYSNEDLVSADAVLFHLHRLEGRQDVPERGHSQQIYVYLTDESPRHTFMSFKGGQMKDFNGLFNWSMSYRSDSDVPVPYGRTTTTTTTTTASVVLDSDYYYQKNKTVAIMNSNCAKLSKRWQYVLALKKALGDSLDIWGHCGPHRCPGGFARDCRGINNYRFYLAFENSECDEYITEKLWWNAYKKMAVPIVMGGGGRKDYEKLAPPHSFLHVDDFSGPLELANFVTFLNSRPLLYNRLHQWRNHFGIANEHGYFGSRAWHYCRLCEALNFNDLNRTKVYNDLESFWSTKINCRN